MTFYVLSFFSKYTPAAHCLLLIQRPCKCNLFIMHPESHFTLNCRSPPHVVTLSLTLTSQRTNTSASSSAHHGHNKNSFSSSLQCAPCLGPTRADGRTLPPESRDARPRRVRSVPRSSQTRSRQQRRWIRTPQRRTMRPSQRHQDRHSQPTLPRVVAHPSQRQEDKRPNKTRPLPLPLPQPR